MGGKTLGGAFIRETDVSSYSGFYRMKIGPFLAEIWPKMSRNSVGLGSKRGRGGCPYWRIYGIIYLESEQRKTLKSRSFF